MYQWPCFMFVLEFNLRIKYVSSCINHKWDDVEFLMITDSLSLRNKRVIDYTKYSIESQARASKSIKKKIELEECLMDEKIWKTW